MRRHGAPARKERERRKDGHAKHNPGIDRGHEWTRARRVALVGEAKADSQEAGYPLGALLLNSHLSDPGTSGEFAQEQGRERHDAGLRYAALVGIMRCIWGAPAESPPSHLASLIAGIIGHSADSGTLEEAAMLRIAERYGRRLAAVRRVPGTMSQNAQHILDRIAVAELYELNAVELTLLRHALAALVAVKD